MQEALVGSVAVVFLGATLVLAQAGRALGQGGRGPGGGTTILEKAPTNRAIASPEERLNRSLRDMDAKKLETLRLIGGGGFNVNIRRIRTAETHSFIRTRLTPGW